jgi:hypothetical protein
MIIDHAGESWQQDATCSLVDDVDPGCVNRHLEIGASTGRWTPTNNCQTFVRDVLHDCSTAAQPSSPPDDPTTD